MDDPWIKQRVGYTTVHFLKKSEDQRKQLYSLSARIFFPNDKRGLYMGYKVKHYIPVESGGIFKFILYKLICKYLQFSFKSVYYIINGSEYEGYWKDKAAGVVHCLIMLRYVMYIL